MGKSKDLNKTTNFLLFHMSWELYPGVLLGVLGHILRRPLCEFFIARTERISKTETCHLYYIHTKNRLLRNVQTIRVHLGFYYLIDSNREIYQY